MNQFYIVVIVKSTDDECKFGQRNANPISPEPQRVNKIQGKSDQNALNKHYSLHFGSSW